MTVQLMEPFLNPATPGKSIPGAPDSVKAGGNARSGTSYGVTWSQQYGGQCPQCGQFSKKAYRHMPWSDSSKVRYHKCPSCGYHFKSVARDK